MQSIVLALAILRDREALDAAFAAVWQRVSRDVPAGGIAKGRCWEDLVELSPDQRAGFQRLCEETDPWTLQDAELAARDGIAIRLRCQAHGRAHTVHMSSPTQQETPAHHLWVTSLLGLAAAAFPDPVCVEYLASVRRYLR